MRKKTLSERASVVSPELESACDILREAQENAQRLCAAILNDDNRDEELVGLIGRLHCLEASLENVIGDAEKNAHASRRLDG